MCYKVFKRPLKKKRGLGWEGGKKNRVGEEREKNVTGCIHQNLHLLMMGSGQTYMTLHFSQSLSLQCTGCLLAGKRAGMLNLMWWRHSSLGGQLPLLILSAGACHVLPQRLNLPRVWGFLTPMGFISLWRKKEENILSRILLTPTTPPGSVFTHSLSKTWSLPSLLFLMHVGINVPFLTQTLNRYKVGRNIPSLIKKQNSAFLPMWTSMLHA